MRSGLFPALALCALGTCVSCASHHLPASPVPASLSEMDAMRMGERFMHQQRNLPSAQLVSAQRDKWGYLLIYHTVFNPYGTPPSESHLVAVHNDGTIRELTFAKGE